MYQQHIPLSQQLAIEIYDLALKQALLRSLLRTLAVEVDRLD
jgi:hypothetical protein